MLLPPSVMHAPFLDSILKLLFLARPFDDMREIAHGDAEREVQGREHDGEEDPPAGHGSDECESAARLVNAHVSVNNSTCDSM